MMTVSITSTLSQRSPKAIAGMFFLIMYTQLLMPLHVSANTTHIMREVHVSNYDVKSHGNMKLAKPEANVAFQRSEVQKSRPSIGGPGQPEMASFQSVNNANMVDLFTGDFSYNIPLMDVGGYPLNIHYSGGISMDQEASWVGLGWNVNPGAITRNMRGLPDDFNGTDLITKTRKIKANETYGINAGGTWELFGKKLKLGAKIGAFKNTYSGWGLTYSINPVFDLSKSLTEKLNAGISLSLSNNSQSGFTVSPSLSVKLSNLEEGEGGISTMGLSTGFNTRAGLSALTFDISSYVKTDKMDKSPSAPFSRALSFARPAMLPSIQTPLTNESYFLRIAGGFEGWGSFIGGSIEGYVNRQFIKEENQVLNMPAYGYLFYQDGNAKPNALLDFNREKEVQFSFGATPAIAIPQYTYDVYSISGEGTGGTIRPYRGDIGFIRDHKTATSTANTNLGLEIGEGLYAHGGVTIDRLQASSVVSDWKADNLIANKVLFQQSDSNYQSTYFRNPGEKTSNSKAYYQQIAGDSLMRVNLLQDTDQKQIVRAQSSLAIYNGLTVARPKAVSEAPLKRDRDKRSQVTSWLNAADASLFGLDKNLVSYPENVFVNFGCTPESSISRFDGSIRKSHHISEMSVLNNDGRKYVYGLPVYNVEQTDFTFSVDQVTDTNDIKNGYTPFVHNVDDTRENEKGKENYFNAEKIPAYAHSFLLTGILSPDYIDITDNGITDDDYGDAIKFNYTRVYGASNGYYNWRTPGAKNKANYNEGFKTYSRDDKATYFFGKKEVWYTHSIESKTMVALFHVSANRPDAASANSDSTGGFDYSKQLRRLDSIQLYAKSDLVKYGQSARPIKTAHFEYTYELCKGADPDIPENGKLTLKEVWFSYYNNKKDRKNGYSFKYSSNNPNYTQRNSDRWGTYKNQANNPGGLLNSDFPYAAQDSATAAINASAWQLTEIRLPSHGRLKLTYEADDYAYVQNRKAAKMTSILGFGASPSQTPVSELHNKKDGYDYVFFSSGITLQDKKDIRYRYLSDTNYLYLKIAVQMPNDIWGKGWEMIPVYGKIKDYGIAGIGNSFWVKLERVNNNSAITRSVLQYLRTNLPSKAYPGSEVGDNVKPKDVLIMLASSITEIANSVGGFTEQSMMRNWCRYVELSKSFARLSAPTNKKFGGGHRVKRVEIYDNWNAMTGGKQESVYGQEYQYLTSIRENNSVKFISSGVASYEPMIGNEENPFREPVPYQEAVAPMAPVDNLYLEMPFGEAYYPGPIVGYSKVRVRTIHNKAKSANGWQESEFFTTKDYPTIVTHTPLDGDAEKQYKPLLKNFIGFKSFDLVTVSQGFRIELNDMNGRPKSNAYYAETDSLIPVSYTRNFYREKIDHGVRKLENRAWVVDSANGKIDTAGTIGLDIEVMTDFRQVVSQSTSAGINPNVDVISFLGGPIPIPTILKIPELTKSQFRSAAVVKIVQRYGILDSVEVMDKGSIVSTRNLVYDGETGEPIITRTKNSFNDPIYTFSYPAHWAYSGMGAAYRNIDFVMKDVKFMEGKLYYKNGKELPVSKYFESGDELMVKANENVTRVTVSNNCPDYTSDSVSKVSRKIWAIDMQKVSGGGQGIYFIDKEGRGYTGLEAELRILRSGKRNILNASVGSISSMEKPYRLTNGQYAIQIDTSTKVLNASANNFSDFWKVDKSFYQVDSCYQFYDTIVISNRVPDSSMLMRQYEVGTTSQPISPSANVINDPHYIASIHGFSSRNYKTKSIIKFNLSDIPSNASVISSSLTLDSYKAYGTWYNNDNMNLSWNDYLASHYATGSDMSGRANAATLKNISTNWNSSTSFNSIATGTASVAIASSTNATCDNKTIDVTSLVSEAKANPSLQRGFLLQLADYNFSSSNEELRVLSFNSGWGDTSVNPHNPSQCLYGAPPVLTVTYRILKDTCVKVCRNYISDTLNNPYRWGILGNWRMEKAFTYYSVRETPTFTGGGTDIRKQGLIANFSPYWNFNSKNVQANIDTTKWVWNSAQSRFNKKGFEVENYDPLGRFNAGLYGYRETMPVAVVQNSRARQSLTDGFEDYVFDTQNCASCPKTRDADFLKGMEGVSLDSLENHTGKYSLSVNAGSLSQVTIPIISDVQDTGSTYVLAKMDSVLTNSGAFDVIGLGNGLQGTYEGRVFRNGNYFDTTGSAIMSPISFNYSTTPLIPGAGADLFYGQWVGYIQPRYTDDYTFYLKGDGSGTLSISSTPVLATVLESYDQASSTVHMIAGQLYPIVITYQNGNDASASMELSWSSSNYESFSTVPGSALYTSTSLSTGSLVSRNPEYCRSLQYVKAQNMIAPSLSPSQNSTIIVSGWVKTSGTDGALVPTASDAITVKFNTSADVYPLVSTGVKIEGWQRVEAVIQVPATSTSMNLKLNANGSNKLYFDDLRMQPYSSTMKSFIYDPVSLKLMAELDENNYSTFYEFDDDGTLIRVKKETERGIMTIKETRSALIKN